MANDIELELSSHTGTHNNSYNCMASGDAAAAVAAAAAAFSLFYHLSQ